MKPEVELKLLSDFTDTLLKALALIAVGSYVAAATLRFAGCNLGSGTWVILTVGFGGLGALFIFQFAARLIILRAKVLNEVDTTEISKAQDLLGTTIFLLVGLGVAIVLVVQFTISNSNYECLEQPLFGKHILEPIGSEQSN